LEKTFPSKNVVYYYHSANTYHTTFTNGLEVFRFANKQLEKHYPNGYKVIYFPDKTIKIIKPDGMSFV